MLREREAQMNDWMIGYVEGKRQALEDAAQNTLSRTLWGDSILSKWP